MSLFSGKINLLSFRNACVTTLRRSSGEKKGVFIPIDDNHLFVSSDDSGKAKSVYANFMAFENQMDRYGESHRLKLSVPKEALANMNEDEKKNIPYIGNMKPYFKAGTTNATTTESVTQAPANQPVRQSSQSAVDDLPF